MITATAIPAGGTPELMSLDFEGRDVLVGDCVADVDIGVAVVVVENDEVDCVLVEDCVVEDDSVVLESVLVSVLVEVLSSSVEVDEAVSDELVLATAGGASVFIDAEVVDAAVALPAFLLVLVLVPSSRPSALPTALVKSSSSPCRLKKTGVGREPCTSTVVMCVLIIMNGCAATDVTRIV